MWTRIWREHRALVALRGKSAALARVLRQGGCIDPAEAVHALSRTSTTDLVAWYDQNVFGLRPETWETGHWGTVRVIDRDELGVRVEVLVPGANTNDHKGTIIHLSPEGFSDGTYKPVKS